MASDKTNFDRIQRYYAGSLSLHPKEMEMVERLELIFSLYLQCKIRGEAIKKYIELQAKLNRKVTHYQAIKDLNDAERIYAPMQGYTKQFLKISLTESAFKDMEVLDERLKKAIEKESNSDIALLVLRKDRIRRTISEINTLGSDESNLPDFDKLIPSEYHIKVPKHLLSALKKMVEKGSVNFSSMDVEDIDFEEMSEDEKLLLGLSDESEDLEDEQD